MENRPKKEFFEKGEIQYSRENKGKQPNSSPFPAISCLEATDMWNAYLLEPLRFNERLILLIGHLVDTEFSHTSTCPIHQLEALKRIKKTYWETL